ncbi:hypothetical protein [Breznakiella homolactica]|uniref:Uncharacterized protein n=1 Tax=Breznakiella homolactica TaxID=2798577 RepID=A0A7T8B7W6_9SPIR|nr:hypothetical protein [Breznakiella homolactica]QQO07969.1 hypothetical protein JFL75_13585 [Breznakiella homolactica]
MGLLSKASSRDSLDEMGKALVERILRIKQGASTADTALNLLKPYTCFQAGLCLALSGNTYTSYAGAGFGIEQVAIPRKKLNLSGNGLRKAGTAEDLGLSRFGGSPVWGFPLDSRTPPGSVLLLIEDTRIPFNPETTEQILTEVSQMLIPAAEASSSGQAAEPADLKTQITRYQKSSGPFQGLILDSAGTDTEKNDFFELLAKGTESFGSVYQIGPSRYIILFPKHLDRNLIAHRITGSFHAAEVSGFTADTVQGAMDSIQPYL